MKLKYLPELFLAVGAAFGTSAMAADSTVNFKGKVVNSACIPSINGAIHATVELPLIIDSMFPLVGDTAGEKPFTIDLKGCQGTAGTIAKAYFWQTASVNGRLTKTDGTGSGWSYELLPGTSAVPLKVGTSSTAINVSTADQGTSIGTNPTGSINYRVRYYRETAAIIPGTLNAKANYVIYTN